VEGFEDPNGKFPNSLGNVALIDCHYLGKLVPLLPYDFCNVTMTVNGVLED
jgi:ABC-type antimicrobial peptide transport system permease subunit